MVAIDGASFDWSYMADDESVSKDISNEVRESPGALLVEELVSYDKLEKKTVFPTVTKIEFVRPKQQEKPGTCPIFLTSRNLMEDMLTLGEEPKERKLLVNELLKLVLPKVPRKNNMYSVDMKNIVRKEFLTCLVAKDTLDESMLWNTRLGHVNFKTINKLVKENLVRGLPTKSFENDQTCVACLNEKQQKASSTKDETSGILKSFITEIANLVDKKVKIIRCDNRTEFKNRVISEFCEKKCIKREFSVARTPQKNGVAERRNKTLIKAARTMLADFKLCKFDAKSDEGFFVGYSLNSKAFRKDDEGVSKESGIDDQERPENSTQDINTVGPSINTASTNVNTGSLNINTVCPTVTTVALEATHVDFFGDEIEVDMSNITTTYLVPSTLNTRIHKDHSLDHVIGAVKSGVQTRRMSKTTNEQGFIGAVYEGKTYEDLHTCCFLVSYLKKSPIRELTFFLGLQVTQKDDGIFISQDKYVDEILKKFSFSTVRIASTPIETSNPLLKDEKVKDVDVHLYRSMIGSLMYLTALRPDIMFDVCACARFKVTPKVSYLHAVKRIFRYLKDKKSTIGGYQFLRSRLISWQCKKQTIVANSTTEAEYVAAASCCGQPRSPTQTPVANKAASTGVDVRYRGATTTVIGLEVGQGSGNIDKTSTMPYDSPLPRVNTLGSDECSMTQNELMIFCTTLSKKVESLETDLKQTKQIYGAAYTKLIKKVKKLEKAAKSSQARRRARIVVSDDEDDLEDPSKQGRKITKLDQDPSISLIQHDAEIQGRYRHDMEFDTTKKDVSTAEPISTTGAAVNSATVYVSTTNDITMAETLVYIRKSAVKDKGKGKMHESKTVQTKTKLQQDQERLGFEAAMRLQAELDEEERQRIAMDDLVMLWSLVKEKFNSTEPTDDKEKEIWVELKRLFEQDIDDELWKPQKHIHDLTWKLYDSCRVHHVSTDKGIDIYMLVEKEYPLSRGTLTLMLVAKLLVVQDNEMSRELLRKIFMQAERPRR
nr:hypothetical protein [Tanacetum cinerariifolium]